MSPASGADSIRYVIDDVVVAAGTDTARDVVEVEGVPHFPCDVVIGAGAVATHANCPKQLARFAVKGKAAAEDVYTSDFLADHGIVGSADCIGGPTISYLGVYGIAMLEAVQAAAGLDGRKQLRTGKGKCRQAESVGGVRLLRRDRAAAGPLVAALVAGKDYCLNNAVAVYKPPFSSVTTFCSAERSSP